MKKINSLLFVFITLVLFVFNSCGSDNEDDPETDEITIVQNSIKGKFYNVGLEAYKFNDNNVDVWTNIVNNGEYYDYQSLSFKIYTEKQYIVINTTPEETLLYYEIKNGILYLYTDAEKTINISNTDKPKEYENQSKEPTNNGEIYLKLDNTIVDFDSWGYLDINTYREMYIKDSKTGKILLTFTWMNYKNIRDIGTMGTKNLVGFTSGRGYIDKIFDGEGNRIYNNEATVNVYDNRDNYIENTTTTILNINAKNIKGYVGVVYEKK